MQLLKVTKMWQSTSKNTKVIIASFLLLVAILAFSSFEKSPELIDKNRALTELSNHKTLEKVMVKSPYIYIYTDSATYKIASDAIEKEKLFSSGEVEYYEESTETMDMILFFVLLSLMFYIVYIMRESRQTQERLVEKQKQETVKQQDIGKLNIMAQRSTINFSDVAGMNDVKEELEEIIDFLRFPAKYRELDIRLPKGVLLVGPPGVGKTLVAKAVAGEADVPFFYQSAASFVQIYVGMGAKRVSELFAKAKEMAPSIIFIDELDAVGKSRGGQSNEEREATLNQLLTEMDGFEESSGVMVIAATNKIEVLDDALLRAGRFDRRVHIGLPDFTERVSTLNLYLKGKKHKVNIERIANMTIGFNSAALATLVNEAALYALRMKKENIETSDMESVKEKVLLGKHKIKTYNEEERKIQALYQAAKAVTASWLEVEYEKVGIISSSFIPHHNEILSKTILGNELKVLLSGRIATQKVYGELFTNAKEDIKLAKVLAHKIIEDFAMTDEYYASVHDAQKLLDEASDEVTSLLSKLASVVENVSTYLLENESITAKETKRILDDLF
jgi:ATP-dependent metalloprotease FtsH